MMDQIILAHGVRFELEAGKNGGEGGIRTHGTVSRTLAFEASTFNRSVTSPRLLSLFYQRDQRSGYAGFSTNFAKDPWFLRDD